MARQEQVPVTLSAEHLAALDAIATGRGISRSAVLREAFLVYLRSREVR